MVSEPENEIQVHYGAKPQSQRQVKIESEGSIGEI
ncbi:unnamed protein product [Acanthoscelides obtectus]|uniref:Uncharacterized protein n=1 Tax=Acanthoscelides obtectus TaxID=200917 RepID=A0A9P0KCE2_ACAOB|nr:unnamed protein product [Acanthoscelides obtectus]CAK1656027.1 hypothetical protein AOBTE_LOCUS19526 [Acanthoscelides obtectus]